jgi:3-deoxy-D-manno-octulosonic-acid transferase
MDLLGKQGIKNVTVSGDTRFDRVYAIVGQQYQDENIARFKQGNIVLVCGSTWEEDEKIICEYINNTDKTIKVIIAPHEISKSHLKKIRSMLNEEVVLFSEFPSKNPSDFRILVIDTMGLLSRIYRYGELAYIGGGFGRGIHNILEPATYGLAVIHGPRYENFNEAHDLIQKKGAFVINNVRDFADTMQYLTRKSSEYKKHGAIAWGYIKKKTGATKIIQKKVTSLLKGK